VQMQNFFASNVERIQPIATAKNFCATFVLNPFSLVLLL